MPNSSVGQINNDSSPQLMMANSMVSYRSRQSSASAESDYSKESPHVGGDTVMEVAGNGRASSGFGDMLARASKTSFAKNSKSPKKSRIYEEFKARMRAEYDAEK